MNEPDCGNREPYTILAVDDIPENLHLLQQILSAEGYLVRAAPSGERALYFARTAHPDLILLDLRMPVMDGYEVCRQLKAEERTREIPVLFISALNETADIVRGFELGGVDYIAKPFRTEEVLARVRTHLTLRRLQLHMESVVRCRTTELEAAVQRQEVLLREIHHRTRNNMTVMMNLIEMQLQKTRDPATMEDLRTLQERIHTMALVQQNLHQIELTYVQLEQLVPQLCDAMLPRYPHIQERVRFDFDLPPLKLPVDIAIPVNMVVRELVSNCLRHAFPDGRSGTVRVRLQPQADGLQKLFVLDDGKGYTAAADSGPAAGLGLQLARMLVEHQLEGSLDFSAAQPGTSACFSFRDNGYSARV
ncbi:MAG: response regulator [Spirochaetes bacterium]|nr:response regulator [Spirochaetota bacterium]MBU0955555.1 response regulator [Spirochaetota bacterium]